jgi:putative oxygen-independent coproporphyrinogen III oxidase
MVKSAYIHIPFCNNICSYCDFCKLLYNKNFVKKYLDALEKEITNNYKNEILDTIYVGGGTPSSLSVSELNKLFSIIKIFKLSKEYEFTFEVNIEDITEEKLEILKENKVNRLSVGIESFNDKYLKYLGRNYTSDIINEKVELAKKYFDNINVDLMYALKNESLDDLEEDIDKILKLDIKHISCYSLIIEKNTKLYIDNTKYISDDLDSDMYDLIDKKLENKYHRYEVSNYSITSYESRHNLTYWKNNEYYGFGLGAAGYIDNIRYTNTRNLSKYISGSYERQEEVLTKEDKIKYEFILGLRLTSGINKDNFNKKYGININEIEIIKELINKGLLIDDKINIYVPKKYFYVLNDILVNFV